ncbi:uncharacterized protein RSE6_04938 [Rhynchosporium secalis]|uniref:Uncharacterized protein n=1 Tax=Rhynchosporium secalis TaxID=38038 RepID=A0A1E1M7T2_RHYSE|nr:uncharacterized protein RSE6_04938 [Rhynchosporium secalis]
MQFHLLNLVLVLLSAFSSLVVALPPINSMNQNSAGLSAGVSSENAVSVTRPAAGGTSIERGEIPAGVVSQQPGTTFTTVVSTAVATKVPSQLAKGSKNSELYSYYVLECKIGLNADECHRKFGTTCNSTTGQMLRQGNQHFDKTFDCMQDLRHCQCVDLIREACIYNRSC